MRGATWIRCSAGPSNAKAPSSKKHLWRPPRMRSGSSWGSSERLEWRQIGNLISRSSSRRPAWASLAHADMT
eukprot:6046750-Pyramimonas_sp.AAC.1